MAGPQPMDLSEVEAGLRMAVRLDEEGRHDEAYGVLVRVEEAIGALKLQQRRRQEALEAYRG